MGSSLYRVLSSKAPLLGYTPDVRCQSGLYALNANAVAVGGGVTGVDLTRPWQPGLGDKQREHGDHPPQLTVNRGPGVGRHRARTSDEAVARMKQSKTWTPNESAPGVVPDDRLDLLAGDLLQPERELDAEAEAPHSLPRDADLASRSIELKACERGGLVRPHELVAADAVGLEDRPRASDLGVEADGGEVVHVLGVLDTGRACLREDLGGAASGYSVGTATPSQARGGFNYPLAEVERPWPCNRQHAEPRATAWAEGRTLLVVEGEVLGLDGRQHEHLGEARGHADAVERIGHVALAGVEGLRGPRPGTRSQRMGG